MASQVPTGPPPPGIQEGTDFNTFLQRGWTKCKQQPFVPIGAVVTVWALLGAVREFKRGNSQNVNRYLRFRVVAQGATVAAMLIGSFVYEKAIVEQKEQEKAAERDRMLRILDALPPSSESPSVPSPVPPPAREDAAPPPPPFVPDEKTSSPAKPRSKQTRYVGESDQWREFFERKNAEKAAGSRAETSQAVPTEVARPGESKRGWFPWSS